MLYVLLPLSPLDRHPARDVHGAFIGRSHATLDEIPDALIGVFGGGASDDAVAAGVTYLSISAFGLVPLLVSLVGGGIFHARQDARTPLVILGTGAVLNLVIELVLVPGLGYGIGASALSTVVAQAGAGTVFAWRVIGWARAAGVPLRPRAAAPMASRRR